MSEPNYKPTAWAQEEEAKRKAWWEMDELRTQMEQLQARCDELERELEEERSSHQTTYNLMLSGENRGVEKGREESQHKFKEQGE